MVGIHTQADLYPNPTTFRPDRFMNNLKTMQSAANGKFEERDHFNFGFGRYIVTLLLFVVLYNNI
jgi:cytochrome P450